MLFVVAASWAAGARILCHRGIGNGGAARRGNEKRPLGRVAEDALAQRRLAAHRRKARNVDAET